MVKPLLQPADTKHKADYAIGISEIRRRMAQPEHFSATNLLSYLRMRRGPSGDLKEKLQQKGVDTTNLGRQRLQLPSSPYLRLCEAECADFARGILAIDGRYFPCRAAGMELAKYQRPAGPSADHMAPAEQKKQLIVNARYWYYPLQINSWLN